MYVMVQDLTPNLTGAIARFNQLASDHDAKAVWLTGTWAVSIDGADPMPFEEALPAMDWIIQQEEAETSRDVYSVQSTALSLDGFPLSLPIFRLGMTTAAAMPRICSAIQWAKPGACIVRGLGLACAFTTTCRCRFAGRLCEGRTQSDDCLRARRSLCACCYAARWF